MRVTHFRDLRWPTEWDKWETLLWQQKPLLSNHQASVCCLVAVVALFKQPTSDIEEKKMIWTSKYSRHEAGGSWGENNHDPKFPAGLTSACVLQTEDLKYKTLYKTFFTLQLLSTGSETNQISTDWFYLQNQNVNWKSEHGHLKWMNSIEWSMNRQWMDPKLGESHLTIYQNIILFLQYTQYHNAINQG